MIDICQDSLVRGGGCARSEGENILRYGRGPAVSREPAQRVRPYLRSFNRERDDLRQWEVYATNGRSFALGIARHLFGIEDKPDRKLHENVFVATVHYGDT